MPRIRTIKPEFWGDEKMGPLSATDRLVFLGLISIADDCGRLLDSVKQIDAFVFPYTEDSARDSLVRLAEIGRIVRGLTSSGQRVVQIKNWHHQKVEKPNFGGALPPILGYEDQDDRTAYMKRKAVPKWMREEVFARDGYRCQSCGKENLRLNKVDKYDAGQDLGEVDNRIEAIDSGEPTPESLVLLCLPCNRKKSSMERSRRNVEKSEHNRRRVAEESPTHHRQVSDVSVPRPTTYDQLSTTNDRRPTINDRRPSTVDQRSTTDAPSALASLGRQPDGAPSSDVAATRSSTLALPNFVLDPEDAEPVATIKPAPSAPPKVRVKRATTAPLQYPHFPMAVREQLFSVWGRHQCPLLGAEHGRFVKAFARWFLKPEDDRAAHEPRDAEVPAALESILSVNKSGGPGAKYGTPELASERIGHIVEVRRDLADDPGRRIEVISRRLGIRMAPPAEFVGR